MSYGLAHNIQRLNDPFRPDQPGDPMFHEPLQTNEDGLTFDQWMAKVDAVVIRTAGLSVFDLADQCYWDMWSDAVPPAEAAELALEDEGFPFD